MTPTTKEPGIVTAAIATLKVQMMLAWPVDGPDCPRCGPGMLIGPPTSLRKIHINGCPVLEDETEKLFGFR